MPTATDIRRINRQLSLEAVAKHGPQHGKGGVQMSKKDKNDCPKKQRKTRSWEREKE